MKQRLNSITIGVADLARSRAFYEALGWKVDGELGEEGPIFFQAGETVIAIWGRDELAEDSCVDNSPGWGGITLAVSYGTQAEVDAVIEEARAAGARIGKEPELAFWGGYGAIFVDPDGHPWEVYHHPDWTVTEDGGLQMSAPGS